MDAFIIGGKPKGKVIGDVPTASSSGKAPARIPWVEKYRPKTVSEVASQDEVVAVLKKTLQGADLPNMLFYGPPGTGKTSTILAVSRELFGKELYRSRVLELNSSDERGISVIREKVKNFSQLAASGTTADGRSCPSFKIIILDEADSMTSAAQAALRRTMEKQTKTTRFCLICNYVTRIIDPLTSRCTKFRFKPLTKEIQTSKLKEICKSEDMECSDEAIEAIIASTEGDLRKAITYLQSAHRLHGELGITVNDINEIAGVVPQDVLSHLIKTCSAGSYDNLETVVQDILQNGYAAYQLLIQLHDLVVDKEDLTDKQKSAIMEKMAIIDKRLCDGAEEYLQVMDMCSFMMDQFCINSEN